MTTSTTRRQSRTERLLDALKAAGPLAGLRYGDVVEVVLEVWDEELDTSRAEASRWRKLLLRCRCSRPDVPVDEPSRECPTHGEPEVMLDELRAELKQEDSNG